MELSTCQRHSVILILSSTFSDFLKSPFLLVFKTISLSIILINFYQAICMALKDNHNYYKFDLVSLIKVAASN